MLLRRVPALSLCFVVLVTAESAALCDNDSKKTLRQNNVDMNVTLHWGTDPARAISALFAALLREGLCYQKVYLRHNKDPDLQTFAAKVPHTKARRYKEVILALAIEWTPGQNPDWAPNSGAVNGMAGPRLEQFSSGSESLAERLHVFVAEEFRNQGHCANVTHWNFYTNKTALKQCGFTNTVFRNSLKSNAMVYEIGLDNTTMSNFADVLHFEIKHQNRKILFEMLRNGNHSFLFMDYNIWAGHDYIKTIPQPFCLPSVVSKCLLEPKTTVTLRVADIGILVEYDSSLMYVINNIHKDITSPKTIRELLEAESKGVNIEQVASQWLVGNSHLLKYVRQQYENISNVYDIAVFYCKDDPYFKSYDDLIEYIYEVHIKETMFNIHTYRFDADCSDPNYVKHYLSHYNSLRSRQRLIGAVVGNVGDTVDIAKNVDGFLIPVVFYDAIGVDTSKHYLSGTTWLVTGNTQHLALALYKFFENLRWQRAAVISERTQTANRFFDELKSVGIFLRDHKVKNNLSKEDAERVLHELKNGDENVHIIIVNTNYKDAATILEAAIALGMTSKQEYAWITREWRPNSKTVGIRHFTFSFWSRCGADIPADEGLSDVRKKIDETFSNCSWPPHASTLGDAYYTFANAFKSLIQKHPELRHDLRHEAAMRLFKESITNVTIRGITQNITLNGHSLTEASVFIDEWNGDKYEHLARWRVNTATKVVHEAHTRSQAYGSEGPPGDGTTDCHLQSGDLYLPDCNDIAVIIALICFILLLPTLCMVYLYIRRQLREREKKIIYEVLAQRKQRATSLCTGYLIDRSAISLRRELGAGRFGFVRLAWLRLPGKTPRYVAAKALRDNQDEREILHEACVLAALQHKNIIQLVGVCIDKDPPLILMEVAFFGDLLQYLRERRYLVEAINSNLIPSDPVDEEAAHVSAEALTRLARQAASALAYLACRGVIHRDLRASNCLVDANRSLKLADFGLARMTKATCVDGDMTYLSSRRGLFPVLWMAPESLLEGVFSGASDVWALGVLLFELVTLGARPYGDMSPLRVVHLVTTGGIPTMPRDASRHTLDITRQCWQRNPDQRPTANDVMAYLADRPYALRPAFDGDDETPTDVDSGCGESPMSEFLPC